MAPMLKDAKYWIEKLRLVPHPEGGYYRETYRADLLIPQSGLSPDFGGARPASTAIYFLLEHGAFSAFHRLRSDEVWHFYAGGPLTVCVIDQTGRYSETLLGSDPDDGQVPQSVVPAGCWFGSRLRGRDSYALVGCTVAPGFDFQDFELARRADLIRLYPQHRTVIETLTRG
ncbi:MAG TPA: cupin domain-containing protein [Terriglobales bacterium]|nr:cupin domain-containing protein [Terriglobales bacterium]